MKLRYFPDHRLPNCCNRLSLTVFRDPEERSTQEEAYNQWRQVRLAAQAVLGPERAERLFDLLSGETAARVAKKKGVHRSTVTRWVKKLPEVFPQLRTEFVARQLAHGLEAEGGCTINPRTGEVLADRSGYLISLADHELVISPTSSTALLRDIRCYVAAKVTVFESHDPQVLIGIRSHTDSQAISLDLNLYAADKAIARDLSKREKQLSVWCLHSQQMISVAPLNRIVA